MQTWWGLNSETVGTEERKIVEKPVLRTTRYSTLNKVFKRELVNENSNSERRNFFFLFLAVETINIFKSVEHQMASGTSDYYDGSRIFTWISDYTGLSIDQVFFF